MPFVRGTTDKMPDTVGRVGATRALMADDGDPLARQHLAESACLAAKGPGGRERIGLDQRRKATLLAKNMPARSRPSVLARSGNSQNSANARS